jgi:hypothetical protein
MLRCLRNYSCAPPAELVGLQERQIFSNGGLATPFDLAIAVSRNLRGEIR